jgi:hypothetical protein
MSAISGDIHFIMMTVRRRVIVTKPNSASIASSLSALSAQRRHEAAWRVHEPATLIRQLKLSDTSDKVRLWT